MNLGKFAVQAIKEWNPLGPEAYARRDTNKAFRKARRKHKRGEVLTPDEEKIMAGEVVTMTDAEGKVLGTREEPIFKARTSSKLLGVGGGLLVATAAAVIPNWDGINAAIAAACESEQGPAIGLGMMGLMLAVNFGTARLTKSPAVPGKVL